MVLDPTIGTTRRSVRCGSSLMGAATSSLRHRHGGHPGSRVAPHPHRLPWRRAGSPLRQIGGIMAVMLESQDHFRERIEFEWWTPSDPYHALTGEPADQVRGGAHYGATYQRCMQKCLQDQIGRNVHAYVDDVVVKTKEMPTLLDDLRETFTNLRRFRMKLNPAKCTFGVPASQLLGYLVSQRGIEANPEKISAIEKMELPQCLKDVQKFTGCLASLRKSTGWGEKATPPGLAEEIGQIRLVTAGG
ncbi:hypothetical protein QYE76_007911 [Lolium multiflorum]|uniref:Reverse transcriptase domain-containing protein n=1 Tax=Lolium multiflorum TaxID=4521 RepID=A0AAD8PHY7_LOLMU|nr:hypothetical protein QYE76_007911 [Lolium multiflorum]